VFIYICLAFAGDVVAMGHEVGSIDHRHPERRVALQLFYGRCSGEEGNTREVFIYICLAFAGDVVAMGHEVGSIDHRHPERRVGLNQLAIDNRALDHLRLNKRDGVETTADAARSSSMG